MDDKGKVIDFLKSKERRSEPVDSGYFIIDTNKKGDPLNYSLDELWNYIYIGNTIEEIFADDDGKIHYNLRPKADDEIEVWKEHIHFLIGIINSCGLAHEVFSKYDDFINEKSIRRILLKKENSPS